MPIWVYLVMCVNSLWCIPEHNRWSAKSYETEEACYSAAGEEQYYVLDRGWVALCIKGRKWSPTEDKHYGCTIQNQAPSGECR